MHRSSWDERAVAQGPALRRSSEPTHRARATEDDGAEPRSRRAHAQDLHSFVVGRTSSGPATSTPTPFFRTNTSCGDRTSSFVKEDAPRWKKEWLHMKQLKEGRVLATRQNSAVTRTGSARHRSPVISRRSSCATVQEEQPKSLTAFYHAMNLLLGANLLARRPALAPVVGTRSGLYRAAAQAQENLFDAPLRVSPERGPLCAPRSAPRQEGACGRSRSVLDIRTPPLPCLRYDAVQGGVL